jgi:hypothetical protein
MRIFYGNVMLFVTITKDAFKNKEISDAAKHNIVDHIKM